MPERDINDTWASFVRRKMRERGMAGPSDLARASGVDQSVISRWLNEGRTPQIQQLRKVASPLGTDLRRLLIEAGYATPDELPVGPFDAGNAVGEDLSVMEAVQNDPHLLPEARAHLLNQYELLLRLQQAAPAALVERQQGRRLAAVARGQESPQDDETEARITAAVEAAVDANPSARKRRK